MAHGSKKWITAYDGKIKRSNDRTKKDYYRDMRYWDEMENGRWYNSNHGEFCPQCKHVQKHIHEIIAEHTAVEDALREKYTKKFGADVIAEWKAYRYGCMWSWRDGRYKDNELLKKPKSEEPPSFHNWAYGMRDYGDRIVQRTRPTFDTRSYLCYKHERKYEVKRNEYWAYWNGNGGYPRKRAKDRRAEYQYYRADIKNIMRRAKFDDDVYDEVYDKTNGWLD